MNTLRYGSLRYGSVRYRKERPDPQKSLVGFVVGDVSYAVPISNVREIINPVPLTVLPHAPASVAGVADHRGDVITVIDLRVHLGMAKQAPSAQPARAARAKWILVRDEGTSLGLIVDRVTDVFGTGGQKLREPPRVSGGDERGFLGVLSRDEVLVFVLDMARFSSLARALQGGLGREGLP